MAETKYISREKEAAEEIDRQIVRQGDYTIENMTTIINRQVVVPLQAKIANLEAEKRYLNTRCSDLWDYTKRLEAEKAEMVEAHRAISLLQGNMYLCSVDKISTIKYGRDRAVKLRKAIEISLTALTKANPKQPKEV